MKALLDTHVFLWWCLEDARISAPAEKIIRTGANQLFLSAASVWEMVVKCQLGKLELPKSSDRFITEELAKNRIQTLPIEASHALRLTSLPLRHKDPFDRILIAQSLTEGMPVITGDSAFGKYDVDVIC